MSKQGAVAGLMLVAMAVPAARAAADGQDHRLEVYWIDVEGGAATLIVTPAGESVLVDAGNPGTRDAERIHKVATEVAGLSQIDHVVVTHFHRDHFGGVAELAALMPLRTLYERDLATAPAKERGQPEIATYQQARVGKRVRLAAGDRLALKQASGAARLSVRVLAASGVVAGTPGASENPACRQTQPGPVDESDNRNSIALRLDFGRFGFFDGGDLTWNAEAELVCPRDRVGPVDVYQADHHGLDQSNNPALVRTLGPTVAVVDNGPVKGNEARTAATLRATPSIRAVYQLHRDVRAAERNTARERIANWDEGCSGSYLRLSVDPDGSAYVVSVPATGHHARYATRPR